tara:strand:+ start:20670 stop:22124 length:1455 start_codon:yes stop_codon:yes gene_type:complete
MIVSGNNFHSLAEQRELSFILRGSVDEITGEATFGFSGENKSLSFDFFSGKIYDPEGRYFDSYNDDNATQYSIKQDGSIFISGNISKNSYDYYNKYGNISCSVGTKEDFKINRFFINTTGCKFDTEIQVYGKEIEYDVTSDSNFVANGNWIAKIKNKDNDRSFKIFDLSGASSRGSFEKVGSYSGVEVINESSITLKHSGSSLGEQDIVLTIDTDMGQIQETFSPLATNEFSVFDYTIDKNHLDTAYSGKNIGATGKEGLFTYNSSLMQASGANSVTAQERDIGIWLLHSGGATGASGDFFRVNGAEITNSGVDYHLNPSIIVSGGDPVTGIDGKVLAAEVSGYVSNGYITGLTVAKSGIYNTAGGLPSLIVSGGGDLVSVTGSGVATSGVHLKDFTGYWNAYYSTGDNKFEDFRSNGYYQSSIGGYYRSFTIDKDINSVYIKISYDNADEDKMVSKLRVDGYNSNQDVFLMTGAISGSDTYLT